MTQHVFNPDQYRFSVYAIPDLVVAAFIISLGIFVMVRERRLRVGLIFPLTSLSMGGYLFSAGMLFLSMDGDLFVLWSRAAIFCPVFIPWTEFLLAAAILDQLKRYRSGIAATFVLAVFFAIAILFSDTYLREMPWVFPWGKSLRYGPLAWIFIFYFLVTAIVILRIYWLAYKRSNDERTRNRLRGIFLSFSVGLLGVVDFLPGLGIEVYPFGYFPIACYTAGMAFVIIRYRLVDITPELATSQILETMQGAVIVVDLDGKIRVVNRAAQDMLGYPRSGLLGRDLLSLLAVHTGADLGGDSRRSIASSEIVWSGWQGREIHVSVSSSPLSDQHYGSRIGTVYVAHDITERKEMERKIRTAATEWMNTFEAITDCIMILDRDQRIIRCNKAALDFLAIPHQQIIGRRCWELMHGTNAPVDGCPTQRMLKTGKRETMILTASDRTSLVTADPVFDEDGGIYQVIHTISDITEQTQLEVKLRQSQTLEAIGRIASGVAHEVRNPLNAILSISEALFNEREIKGNTEYEPYIKHIRTQVNRLSSLMTDLLELGRPVPTSSLVTIPIREVCQETLKLWKATETAKEHPVRILFDFGSEGPLVLADSARLQQALINLLDNAAQNSSAGSGIELRIVETLDGWAVIQIADGGTGIPPEKIGRIFDPFFTTRKGGTGLGLSIVKHCVENMGGSITIRNNEQQPGCTAEVKLRIDKGGEA